MIKKVNSSKKQLFSAISRRSRIRVVRLNYHPGTVAKPGLRLSISGLKDHPEVSRGSLKTRKIYFKGSISRGSWVRKYIERVAKQYATVATMKEINPNNGTPISWVSFAREYANQLPATIITLAIYKGNFLIKRRWARQKEGCCRRGLSLELYPKENHGGLRDRKKLTIGKAKSNSIPTLRDESSFGVNHDSKEESTLGWPLLRISPSEEYVRKSEAREMSVVQWVMSLPNRFQEADISTFDSEVERDSLRLIQSSEDTISRSCDDNSDLVSEQQVKMGKASVSSSCLNESTLSSPGWPLLHVAVASSLDSSRESEAIINMSSMFQLEKPKQINVSPLPQFNMVSNKTRNPSKRNNENCLVPPEILVNELERPVRTNSSRCTRFSYAELKIATDQFSPDNLIGEGGCSSVYRGCLPNGKSVAVKILKPYKEAWNDLSLEVEILSSIKHEHITPLIGFCVENIHLISVYDLYPKGSLEENLHGGSSKLTLEVRFKVAVSVAEALNYLHNDGPRPVIHRDIKSSNILLTNELQPQLSDFGLAIWGSTDSPYVVHSDVVGTFGYIAPEYFMNGRVSDKIDVYAFGVILLELLSGRRPIGSEVPKGQESLVKWAKHLLERGDSKGLLDTELNGDFDDARVQRMVLAARLCISQSARVRPKVSQILKLLRGKKDAEECVTSHVMDPKELGYEDDDDDLVLKFGCQTQSGFGSPGADSATIPSTCAGTSPEKGHRLTLKDYFKELQV